MIVLSEDIDTVILTPNAPGTPKLVGEAYPFRLTMCGMDLPPLWRTFA
jgi:hypothetical protein